MRNKVEKKGKKLKKAQKKGLYATMNGWRIDPFFVSLYFLPVNQSLSHIIQFYGKGDYFPLIRLERLGILLGFHLLLGSIHATVVAQLLK